MNATELDHAREALARVRRAIEHAVEADTFTGPDRVDLRRAEAALEAIMRRHESSSTDTVTHG